MHKWKWKSVFNMFITEIKLRVNCNIFTEEIRILRNILNDVDENENKKDDV